MMQHLVAANAGVRAQSSRGRHGLLCVPSAGRAAVLLLLLLLHQQGVQLAYLWESLLALRGCKRRLPG